MKNCTQKTPTGQIEGIAIVCYIQVVGRLLIATNNRGKKREYEQLLSELPLHLCSPQDLQISFEVDEDGASYAENARSKALTYLRASGLPTLADDSGLEVDVLGGEPGLHSARYAGPAADDLERHRLLLQNLEQVPWERRTARFRCLLVLAAPGGETYETEGICEGVIAFSPKGSHGFGYDPVFYLPGYDQTMAQLSPELKNRISHRARAVQKMLPILRRVLSNSETEGA